MHWARVRQVNDSSAREVKPFSRLRLLTQGLWTVTLMRQASNSCDQGFKPKNAPLVCLGATRPVTKLNKRKCDCCMTVRQQGESNLVATHVSGGLPLKRAISILTPVLRVEPQHL